MIFGSTQSRKEILEHIQNEAAAFDAIIAMANVGAAFISICNFESLLGGLILSSRTQIEVKLPSSAISEADLFLSRHHYVRSSPLGRLVRALENSGIEGRDMQYLRAILEIRNEFIHRFMDKVPLPGDWERYGYSLEDFSEYTRYVTRHMHLASYFISRIMHKHGLVAGEFGDFGALLWNPDSPMFNSLDP